MNKLLSLIGLTILMFLGWAAPAMADPEPNPGVCPEGGAWSVHLSANDLTSFSFTAPTGFAVAELCVKAGSLNQELGPEFSTFDPPIVTVTFGHSSGKEISHFSVRVVPVTVEETTTTTSTPTTLPETTTTAPVVTTVLTEAPATVDIGTPMIVERELARTGNELPLALGAALVAGGTALVVASKRRSA